MFVCQYDLTIDLISLYVLCDRLYMSYFVVFSISIVDKKIKKKPDLYTPCICVLGPAFIHSFH